MWVNFPNHYTVHYKRVPALTLSYKYGNTINSHIYYSTQLSQPCHTVILHSGGHSMLVSRIVNLHTIYKWVNCAKYTSGHTKAPPKKKSCPQLCIIP